MVSEFFCPRGYTREPPGKYGHFLSGQEKDEKSDKNRNMLLQPEGGYLSLALRFETRGSGSPGSVQSKREKKSACQRLQSTLYLKFRTREQRNLTERSLASAQSGMKTIAGIQEKQDQTPHYHGWPQVRR